MASRFLDDESTWASAELGLDERLQKAAARLGYVRPTLVQSRAIPLALAGRDLLVRAATGSGKTAAYGLAVLQKILASKTGSARGARGAGATGAPVRALVLVPTRELVDQTVTALRGLASYCSDLVTIVGLGGARSGGPAARLLAEGGIDIVVATPTRAASYTANGSLVLKWGGAGTSAAAAALSSSSPATECCDTLVVDEADLCLSYGHDGALRTILAAMPRAFHGIMLSATLSPALEGLHRLVLHSPATVRLLDEGGGGGDGGDDASLTQLYLRCVRDDRFLVLYALLRLKLIGGRTLIFVNSIDGAHKLKLFLDRFALPAAVLNAELPANSRASVISQFNAGLFDLLIATDEGLGEGEEEGEGSELPPQAAAASAAAADAAPSAASVVAAARAAAAELEVAEAAASAAALAGGKEPGGGGGARSRKRQRERSVRFGEAAEGEGGVVATTVPVASESAAAVAAVAAAGGPDLKSMDEEGATPGAPASSLLADASYGVSRGLDFQRVTTVVNFDCPTTTNSYRHRIGRTARGGATGAALTFFPPEGVDVTCDKVLTKLQAQQPCASTGAPCPAPLPFDLQEVGGFRYRVEDVMRSLTPAAIRASRVAELKREALASVALAAHWEDHPRDLTLLKHERPLERPARVSAHLRGVPAYLLPSSLRASLEAAGAGPGTSSASAAKRKKARNKARKGLAAKGGAPPPPSSSVSAGAPPPLPPMRLSQKDVATMAARDAYAPHASSSLSAAMGAGGRGGGGRSRDPLRTFALNAARSGRALR